MLSTLIFWTRTWVLWHFYYNFLLASGLNISGIAVCLYEVSSIPNYLAHKRFANSYEVLETFRVWASALNQGELSSCFPFLRVQSVTAVCWLCLPNSVISRWFTFWGHSTSTCWELNKTSIFHYRSGNHTALEGTTFHIAQKYPAYHMKANVFLPLRLLENRGRKGQFSNPKVGASSLYFSVRG